MTVDKLARRPDDFRRRVYHFRNARTALGAFLKAAAPRPNDQVLLPAYIGWSVREGSGVFDPVQELGLRFSLYRVDPRLRINLDDLEGALRSQRVRILLLIHYFGYIDPSYQQAVALARRYGALILEDEAHAMLTDLIGGGSGRLGDACIFSFHKLLPVAIGGSLVLNHTDVPLSVPPEPECSNSLPWCYDLVTIARRRRYNAERLHGLLEPLAEHLEPLWGPPGPGEVPQTYPVLVRNVSRDRLYFAMNEAGFGVVSLYHMMIKPIADGPYAESVELSRKIMNLPVHQDVEPEDLERLVSRLGECLRALS